MKEENYPIINVASFGVKYDKDQTLRVDPDSGKKYLYKHNFFGYYAPLNEVCFSKLGKLIDVNVSNNSLAVAASPLAGVQSVGIASEWWQDQDHETIAPITHKRNFRYLNQQDYQTLGVSKKRFNNVDLKSMLNFYRKDFQTTPEFDQNLVETYLHGILTANFDRDECYNLALLRDRKTGITMPSPAYDFEATYLSHDYYGELLHQFNDGYRANLPYLKTEHAGTLEKFLDNASSVDLGNLTDFSDPKFENFMPPKTIRRNISSGGSIKIRKVADAESPEQYGQKLRTGLKHQIKTMKDFGK